MRKTSYDGADSSSITSGKDSDTKKCAASFNKMTKSSIKRKVQNFSHDSDDGIIEPLLQTDREKIEIANRSAKYLLNKYKTESLHEKDNKVTDGYADKRSVSITVSSTSNIMVTNNMKESPVFTSYICEYAPVHNHMNTNKFSSYEASTGLITTKNQIIVEIDNSKPGSYSPSPLIFTTAKIHTDSNTEVIEPVQLTPVPILSTLEGNIKAGAVPGPEIKTSSLTKTSSDGIKVLSRNPEVNILQTDKDKTCLPTVAYSFLKSEALNENAKKLETTTSSLESSANLIYRDIKLVQLSNTEILPAAPKFTSSKNTSLKEQTFINIPTTQTNISITDKVKIPTETLTSASSSNNMPGKCCSLKKSEENFHTSYNENSKILLDPLNLKNQDNVHNKSSETPEHQKTFFNTKDSELVLSTSVSSNKKLQRQKNASNEATNDSDNKTLKTDTQNLLKQTNNNSSAKTVKVPKQENKSDLPIATKVLCVSSLTSERPPKSVTPSSLTEMKNIVLVSTPKVKPVLETVNLKPTLTSVGKDVTKPQTQSSVIITQTDVKDSKDLPTISSTLASSALSSSKLAAVSVSVKPDILSSSPCTSHSVKNNPSINSTLTTVNTPLPSYIVSTSKTKIGLTMTTNTPAVTLKTQIQNPNVNVHTTSTFATCGAKTSASPSAANGTKNTVFTKQAKSNAETNKKDGRA